VIGLVNVLLPENIRLRRRYIETGEQTIAARVFELSQHLADGAELRMQLWLAANNTNAPRPCLEGIQSFPHEIQRSKKRRVDMPGGPGTIGAFLGAEIRDIDVDDPAISYLSNAPALARALSGRSLEKIVQRFH
jgi:hypothetical protein